ncbi:MAG TPA: GNAT family N-acetyltransferase [Vicinamibacteria bacterium]|nr:GNAT family N-acetyltransferase [Vicinamibacteria bacterium]
MLFASTALAARIERADARLMSESASAAARRRRETRAFALSVAGGAATYAAPGSPLNKVAGLGFAGPLDPAELDAVERAFAERGAAVQVELSCLAEPQIGALLTRRGYTLENFENVLGRRLPTAPSRALPDDVVVSVSEAGESGAWLDLVITAFASPDAQGVPSHESFPRDELERVMDDMAQAEGFVRYLARRGGVPAGGASMRLFEGVAQLCGAATLPEHRRRGVQSAMLAARLEAASRAGCDVAVVTTQPGSKSQENVQKQGFELLYTRAILVRQP